MTDRRLLPLAFVFITACSPTAPLLLPSVDAGGSDRGDAATESGSRDAPLLGDAPVVDVVSVDSPDVPMVADVPAVMDVASVMDVSPSIDVPVAVDAPAVDAGGSACPGGMVFITGGTFMMGSAIGEPDEVPIHTVRLSSLCLDVTEVTTAAYRSCPAATCSVPGTAAGCNWAIAGNEGHPINCVDWNQASAYCAWRGGSLPTEAQWEYAALGPGGALYPWGNDSPQSRSCCSVGPVRGGTCASGSFPSGNTSAGLVDMIGSVWEWTADWYGPYTAASVVVDPVGPASGSARTTRGGCWADQSADWLRSAWRRYVPPTGRYTTHGFRCAHAPL